MQGAGGTVGRRQLGTAGLDAVASGIVTLESNFPEGNLTQDLKLGWGAAPLEEG